MPGYIARTSVLPVITLLPLCMQCVKSATHAHGGKKVHVDRKKRTQCNSGGWEGDRLEKAGHHSVAVGELTHLHGAVRTAGVQPALGVRQQVRHAHANVAEQRAPRVLIGESVEQHMNRQAPHLDVAVSRASNVVLLPGVQGEALDGCVVCLKLVTQLPLPHVKYEDVAFLASRNQELVLRCKYHSRAAVLVAREGGHKCLSLGQKCVPQADIAVFRGVARSSNQTR